MGKSYMGRLLRAETGARHLVIDAVYTSAVFAAGMTRDPRQNAPDTRTARRHARDRRWPDAAATDAFFASYEEQIHAALADAHKRDVPVVLEGGTLRHDIEVDIVVKHAQAVHDGAARVVRMMVAVPYDRWLQNRVDRAARSGSQSVRVEGLLEQRYQNELERSSPSWRGDVEDITIGSLEDLWQALERLHAQPRI